MVNFSGIKSQLHIHLLLLTYPLIVFLLLSRPYTLYPFSFSLFSPLPTYVIFELMLHRLRCSTHIPKLHRIGACITATLFTMFAFLLFKRPIFRLSPAFQYTDVYLYLIATFYLVILAILLGRRLFLFSPLCVALGAALAVVTLYNYVFYSYMMGLRGSPSWSQRYFHPLKALYIGSFSEFVYYILLFVPPHLCCSIFLTSLLYLMLGAPASAVCNDRRGVMQGVCLMNAFFVLAIVIVAAPLCTVYSPLIVVLAAAVLATLGVVGRFQISRTTSPKIPLILTIVELIVVAVLLSPLLTALLIPIALLAALTSPPKHTIKPHDISEIFRVLLTAMIAITVVACILHPPAFDPEGLRLLLRKRTYNVPLWYCVLYFVLSFLGSSWVIVAFVSGRSRRAEVSHPPPDS